METAIHVLIADDHPVVRQGLRQAIEADSRLTIVAEASDGRSALEHIETLRPRVAVLDIDMPGLDGFAVAREVRSRKLPSEIVFLTVHLDESFFDEAMRVGAKGYVVKDAAVTDIVSAILAVARGQHYTSPALTSYLVTRRKAAAVVPPAGLQTLTAAERQVLGLIAEYKTSRQIGEALHVSHRTVQTHRTNICAKLQLHGSHALMKFALDHKAEL